jgi:hypothetical protein
MLAAIARTLFRPPDAEAALNRAFCKALGRVPPSEGRRPLVVGKKAIPHLHLDNLWPERPLLRQRERYSFFYDYWHVAALSAEKEGAAFDGPQVREETRPKGRGTPSLQHSLARFARLKFIWGWGPEA